jgi:hypothetical protein
VANATEKKDFVDFETLSWTATETESATAEFALNVLLGHLQAGREPLDDDDESLAV